jgi:hypothetical protein
MHDSCNILGGMNKLKEPHRIRNPLEPRFHRLMTLWQKHATNLLLIATSDHAVGALK